MTETATRMESYQWRLIFSLRVPRWHEHLARGFEAEKQLDIAQKLDALLVPPGNRLEPLKRDRKGQHSIRINDKYRVCFVWTESGVEDVEIVDYH